MFPTRFVQKPSSVPTLLTARPSLDYQDNLLVQYVYLYTVLCPFWYIGSVTFVYNPLFHVYIPEYPVKSSVYVMKLLLNMPENLKVMDRFSDLVALQSRN
jgi:hypothetical protein